MELRRLIKSGQTSFTISLPIAWVKRHKLKKHDTLSISDEGDFLILKPQVVAREQERREHTINVDALSPGTLNLELLRAYLSGASVIWFSAKDMNQLQERLRHSLPSLPGMEFEEMKQGKIAYRNYFDMHSLSYASLLQKQKTIVTTLLSETEAALVNPRKANVLTLATFIDGIHRQNTLILAKVSRAASITNQELRYVLLSNTLSETARAIKDFLTAMKYADQKVMHGLFSQFRTLRANIEAFILEERHEHLLLIQSQTEHCRALARQASSASECLVYQTLAVIGATAEQYARAAIIHA